MPNQKQPVELIQFKGRKHLTKDEISQRQSAEISAPCDNLVPPAYLNAKQREEFISLAAELAPLGILGNVDAGELARYCVAHWFYGKYTKLLQKSPKKKANRLRREAAEAGTPISPDIGDEELALDLEVELANLQGKYFDQCEKTAKSLGLCITSRCRLIIPTAPPAQPSNKFARFDKTAAV